MSIETLWASLLSLLNKLGPCPTLLTPESTGWVDFSTVCYSVIFFPVSDVVVPAEDWGTIP